MKTKQVLKGFNYVATSVSGSTITDENGVVICQIPAGKQGFFTATTESVDCGTDDVQIVEIRGNFNFPAVSGGGGGGEDDPTPFVNEITRLQTEKSDLEAQRTTLSAVVLDLGSWDNEKTQQVSLLTSQVEAIDEEVSTLQERKEELESFLTTHSAGDIIGIGENGQTTDIGALITTGGLFYGNNDITAWYGNMPNLVDSTEQTGAYSYHGMFQDCKNLQEFYGELPSLQNGKYFFYGCSSLKSVSFGDTDSLPPNLTGDISDMFYGTAIEDFSLDIPEGITSTSYMFAYSKIKTFSPPSGTLPTSLTNCQQMFWNSSLVEFNCELPENALFSQTFEGTNIEVFTTPSKTLPSNYFGYNGLLQGVDTLIIFDAQIADDVEDTSSMFRNCTSLRVFNSDMPSSLMSAMDMFKGCKLNKTSVQRIVETMPTGTGYSARITIGIDSSEITQVEQNAFNATMSGKGWTVSWERN